MPPRPSRTRRCSPTCSCADTLDADLWAEFTDRRFARAKAVVDASMQLAQWQLDHERGDVPGLMRGISQMLATPA